jgi:hypothetical protein
VWVLILIHFIIESDFTYVCVCVNTILNESFYLVNTHILIEAYSLEVPGI